MRKFVRNGTARRMWFDAVRSLSSDFYFYGERPTPCNKSLQCIRCRRVLPLRSMTRHVCTSEKPI